MYKHMNNKNKIYKYNNKYMTYLLFTRVISYTCIRDYYFKLLIKFGNFILIHSKINRSIVNHKKIIIAPLLKISRTITYRVNQ